MRRRSIVRVSDRWYAPQIVAMRHGLIVRATLGQYAPPKDSTHQRCFVRAADACYAPPIFSTRCLERVLRAATSFWVWVLLVPGGPSQPGTNFGAPRLPDQRLQFLPDYEARREEGSRAARDREAGGGSFALPGPLPGGGTGSQAPGDARATVPAALYPFISCFREELEKTYYCGSMWSSLGFDGGPSKLRPYCRSIDRGLAGSFQSMVKAGPVRCGRILKRKPNNPVGPLRRLRRGPQKDDLLHHRRDRQLLRNQEDA